jgi:hypothetical protein
MSSIGQREDSVEDYPVLILLKRQSISPRETELVMYKTALEPGGTFIVLEYLPSSKLGDLSRGPRKEMAEDRIIIQLSDPTSHSSHGYESYSIQVTHKILGVLRILVVESSPALSVLQGGF